MFVSFGEILGRLHFDSDSLPSNRSSLKLYYGGSEANVASALATWGIPATHVTVLPNNKFGQGVKEHLQSFGVNTRYIQYASGKLGIYYSIYGSGLLAPEVIYDRQHSLFEQLNPDWFQWDEILSNASWFHWSGITPAISANAAKSLYDALKICMKRKVMVSADINYRRVLWKYGKHPTDVMPELMAMSNILIGSPSDFVNCTGMKVNETADIEETERVVSSYFGSKKIISYTERIHKNASEQTIQGFLQMNDHTFKSRIYNLYPIKDRIGSGDAFVAGLIYALLHSRDPSNVIETATVAAAVKHFIHGDVLTTPWDEIELLSKQQSFGKLLR